MKKEVIALYIDDGTSEPVLLADLLNGIKRFKVHLNQASGLEVGIQKIQQASYDIIFFDLNTRDTDQVHSLESLKKYLKREALIVISDDHDLDHMYRTLDYGVQEYLFKEDLQIRSLEKAIYFSFKRKKKENQIYGSKRKYETLFNINPESTVITRLSDGQILSVNNSFTQTFGWTKKECEGKTTLELGLWIDLAEREKALASIPEKNQVRNLKANLRSKSGQIIPGKISFTSYELDGEKYLVGILVNETKVQAQEKALRIEKERFKTLIESAPDIFFYSSSLNAIDYVCPQVKKHLGYDADELKDFDYRQLLTEKSLKTYDDFSFTELFKSKAHKVFRPFELKTKTGKLKQYELRLIPVRDHETNRVIFVQGIARDITEELQTLELLETSHKKNLASLEELKTHQYAIDQHNMVVITDIEGKVKFANDNFCKKSGYSLKELQGKTTAKLNSGVHDQAYFKDMWDTILAGKVWKGNICNKHKDGSFYWLTTTIIPRYNNQGDIDEFIALRTDISELKEAEQSLRNVLDSNPHEIWSVNTQFELQSFNEVFGKNFKQFYNHSLGLNKSMIEIEVLPQEVLNTWKDRYQKAFKGDIQTYKDVYPIPGEKGQKFKYVNVIVYPTYSSNGIINGAGVFSQDISERENAKVDLEISNKRLEKAQTQAKIGDWHYHLQNQSFFWSENLNQILGFPEGFGSPEDVQSLLGSLSETHRETLVYGYNNTLAGKGDRQVIVEFVPDSGKCIWLECSFSLDLDEEGQPLMIRGVIRDVDELIRSQMRENMQKKLFIELANNGSELIRLNSTDQVYQSLCKSLFRWFDEKVIILTTDVSSKEGNDRFSINQYQVSKEWLNTFSFLEEAVRNTKSFEAIPEIRQSLKSGKVFRITKEFIPHIPFLSKELAHKLLKAMPNYDLVAIGLFYKNSLSGSCFALFPKGLPESYSDELFEILANQASAVMDLVLYRNELKENALILSQALEAADSAVWRYDFTSDDFTGDSKLYRMLGLPKKHFKALKGTELQDRFGEKYLSELGEAIAPKLNGDDFYKIEFRFTCFDDSLRYFEDRAKITKRDKDGAPLEIIGIRTDISARKQREEQLLLLESSVTNANEGILITDARVKDKAGPTIVFANKAMEQISGYSVEELIGKSPKFLQGELTDKEELMRISEALRNHEKVESEIINYHKNGTAYYVSLSIVPIRNKKNEVTHFVALERDTTEEHNQREKIKALLTRFELVTRISKIGIYDLDPISGVANWDEGMYDIYEQDPEGFEVNLMNWNALLIEDDQHKSIELFNESLENGTDEFSLTFKVKCASGLKYVQAIIRIFRDDAGNPEKVVGLNWDITDKERRRMEMERLRLNTQALINNTEDHMWSIDPRFRLLSANDSYLNYLRTISDKDFKVGDTILDPILGEERISKWKPLYQKALSGEKVQLQLQDQTKYGDFVLVVSLYPIRNTQGIITGVACYSFDDTERITYLNTIKDQNQRLKDIAWMQSHVMRAPVARVLGLIELLKEEKGAVNAETQEILNFIEDSSVEMDAVIKEITEKTKRFGIDLE